MTARPKSWLGRSATSSTRANACAFFVLPDAARQQKNSDHSPQSAQSSQRGEREVPIFSKIVFLSVFSSVFSVTSVVSFLRSFRTSSKGPLSLNGCNLDKGCWATEQCMPDTCNA